MLRARDAFRSVHHPKMLSSLGKSGATWALCEQGGQAQQIDGQHGCADEHLKAVMPRQPTAIHPAAAHQQRDRALDPRAETLALLERAALLRLRTLGAGRVSPLRDAELSHLRSVARGPRRRAAKAPTAGLHI